MRKLCIYWTDTLTTVCLPSCYYALNPKTCVEQFGVNIYCIRACFWLYCTLFHAAPTILCTLPISNDPVVVAVDEKGRCQYIGFYLDVLMNMYGDDLFEASMNIYYKVRAQ